jgi:RNA recognition motif-containing protein
VDRKSKFFIKRLNYPECGLVDEEEVYRIFGGYLPVEVHTRKFFFKTPR